jgi:hypothetical protein
VRWLIKDMQLKSGILSAFSYKNMAAIVDPERGLASIRGAAAFGIRCLKESLAYYFFLWNVKKFS